MRRERTGRPPGRAVIKPGFAVIPSECHEVRHKAFLPRFVRLLSISLIKNRPPEASLRVVPRDVYQLGIALFTRVFAISSL